MDKAILSFGFFSDTILTPLADAILINVLLTRINIAVRIKKTKTSAVSIRSL